MMNKVRFLHIVKDDKFEDLVRDSFAHLDQVSSSYIHYHPSKRALRFIGGNPAITVYSNRRDFVRRIKASDYDVLYLHSLHPSFYPFINSIPRDKTVIWWEFGYDIYGQRALNLDSFIKLDFFKEETLIAQAAVPFATKCKRLFFKYFLNSIYAYYRNQFLGKVDYFQPVCSIDFDLMKAQTGFAAKEFYLPFWSNFSTGDEKPVVLDPRGDVLIANSAVYEENHLDVWKAAKPYITKEQGVLVPLSYGDIFYARQVKATMNDGVHKIRFLDSFLPRDEYFSLFSRCSYALFGTIRQHSMGNIYNAILHGLKIFLYTDSVVYKYLTDKGVLVFPIEEIGEDSFRIPLTAAEQQHNFDALYKEQEEYCRKGLEVLEEIAREVGNSCNSI